MAEQVTNYENFTAEALQKRLSLRVGKSVEESFTDQQLKVFVTSPTMRRQVGRLVDALVEDNPLLTVAELLAWGDAAYAAGYEQGFSDGNVTRQ